MSKMTWIALAVAAIAVAGLGIVVADNGSTDMKELNDCSLDDGQVIFVRAADPAVGTGVPIQLNFNAESALVNPEDIESITVLKDAAATAIYGAEADRVILITAEFNKVAAMPATELKELRNVASAAVKVTPNILYIIDAEEFSYASASYNTQRLGDVAPGDIVAGEHSILPELNGKLVTAKIPAHPYHFFIDMYVVGAMAL